MHRSSRIRRAAWLSALTLGALTSPAHATYWSLFNAEGESALTAQYVTYNSLNDMLTDTNRLGVFNSTGGSAGPNIVGSGSDVVGGGTVPEPTTLSLGALAGLLLMATNRLARRRGSATSSLVAIRTD